MFEAKKINLKHWKNRNFIVFYNNFYYKFEIDSEDDFCDLNFDSNSLVTKSILDLDIKKYANYGLVALSEDNAQLVDWNSLRIFGDKKFLKRYVWWFLPPVFLFGWAIVIFKYKKIKNQICSGFFSVHNELILDKYRLQEDLGGEEEILEAKRLISENQSFKQISNKLDNHSRYFELTEDLDNSQYQKILDLKREYSDFYNLEKALNDPRLQIQIEENHVGLLNEIYQKNNNDIYQIQKKIWDYDEVSNDLIKLQEDLGGEEEILEAKRLFSLNNGFRNIAEKLSDPRLKFEIKDSSQLAVLSDLYEKNNRNVIDIQNKIRDYDEVFNNLNQLKDSLGGEGEIFKIQRLFNEYKSMDEICKKLEDPKLNLSVKNEHLDSIVSIYRENNEDPLQIQKKIQDYDSVKGKLDSLEKDLGGEEEIFEAKKLLEKNDSFRHISNRLDNYSKYSELTENLDNSQYQKILDLNQKYSDFYEIEKQLRDPKFKLSVKDDHIDLMEKIYQDNNNDVYQIQDRIEDSYKWSQLVDDLGEEGEIHAFRALIKKYGSTNEISRLLSDPKLSLDIDYSHLSNLTDIYKRYDGDISKIQNELKFARDLIDVNNYGCSNEVEVKNKLMNSISNDQLNVLKEYGKMNNKLDVEDVQSFCSYIQDEMFEKRRENTEKFGSDHLDKSTRWKNYEKYVCDLIEEIYSQSTSCSVEKQYHLDGLHGDEGYIDCLIKSTDPKSPISVKMVVEVKYSDDTEKIDVWGMKIWNKQLKNYAHQIGSHINLIVTNRYVSKTNFWKSNSKDQNSNSNEKFLFFIINDSILKTFMLSMSFVFHLCHSTSRLILDGLKQKQLRDSSSDPDMQTDLLFKSILEVIQIHDSSDEEIIKICTDAHKKIQKCFKDKNKKLANSDEKGLISKIKYYSDINREILKLEGSETVEVIEEDEDGEKND